MCGLKKKKAKHNKQQNKTQQNHAETAPVVSQILKSNVTTKHILLQQENKRSRLL